MCSIVISLVSECVCDSAHTVNCVYGTLVDVVITCKWSCGNVFDRICLSVCLSLLFVL